MKRWYYQAFASILTFMGVMGAILYFFSLKFRFDQEILIRWTAILIIPVFMVILNMIMNIIMNAKQRFNRKLQSMLYPNLIHLYPIGLLLTYIEFYDGEISIFLLQLLGLSTLVALGLSGLMFILGWIAERTYHQGWFTFITTIIGLTSVVLGVILYLQIA